MKLLTQEIRKRLPKLYSAEKQKDPIVWVKFFTPWSFWTFYALEFDKKDRFFGWVVGHEKELGYFSLSELQSVKGPYGLGIERDLYFKPKPLSEVKKEHLREHGRNPTGVRLLNPRPPRGWWAIMWPRMAATYPKKKGEAIGKYKESIDQITAGVWWNYPEKTRKALLRKYD